MSVLQQLRKALKSKTPEKDILKVAASYTETQLDKALELSAKAFDLTEDELAQEIATLMAQSFQEGIQLTIDFYGLDESS